MAGVITVGSDGGEHIRVDNRQEPQAGFTTISQFNTGGIGGSEGGPFVPGTQHTLAMNLCENIGDPDFMNAVFAELDSNGNVVEELCRVASNQLIAQFEQWALTRDEFLQCDIIPDTSVPWPIQAQVSSQQGDVQQWGFKVWAFGENEPSFSVAAEEHDALVDVQDEFINNFVIPTGIAVVSGTISGIVSQHF